MNDLKVYVENLFREYQYGFCSYRSTIDEIFIIQQVFVDMT